MAIWLFGMSVLGFYVGIRTTLHCKICKGRFPSCYIHIKENTQTRMDITFIYFLAAMCTGTHLSQISPTISLYMWNSYELAIIIIKLFSIQNIHIILGPHYNMFFFFFHFLHSSLSIQRYSMPCSHLNLFYFPFQHICTYFVCRSLHTSHFL